MNKRTEELMQMLNTADALEDYWAVNQNELLEPSPEIYLNKLLKQYQVTKNEVIRRSGLNQIYGYQIFAGSKKPSRDKLIALIFGFPLHLNDAQRLLRIAQMFFLTKIGSMLESKLVVIVGKGLIGILGKRQGITDKGRNLVGKIGEPA